jgi:hypothetical protein
MFEFLELVGDGVLERLPYVEKVKVGFFNVRLNQRMDTLRPEKYC